MSTAESQLHFNGRPYRLCVVMGVAGAGKTVVGGHLAEQTGGRFIDADDLHPETNVEKMRTGQPLTDADRWPWLTTVGQTLSDQPGLTIAACSALKKSYRAAITKAAGEPVLFVHLDGPKSLIAARMQERTGHFMPTSLLDSQFATLQQPTADETAMGVAIDRSVAQIVTEILSRCGQE